jgi:hypothetical protein
MGGAIGHNRGPALDVATGWKTHCWRQAREALLPTLPVEVVRLRVKRAKELGLPYKTYAGIRAQTGHDVVAFLFSSNALKAGPLSPMLSAPIAAKLAGLTDVALIGLASAPLAPGALALNPELDRAHAAPYVLASFPLTARTLRAAMGPLPADRVVLVGFGALERDWCAAGRLAAFLPGAQYFCA